MLHKYMRKLNSPNFKCKPLIKNSYKIPEAVSSMIDLDTRHLTTTYSF
jgi:hypothetical protein